MAKGFGGIRPFTDETGADTVHYGRATFSNGQDRETMAARIFPFRPLLDQSHTGPPKVGPENRRAEEALTQHSVKFPNA